MNAAHDAADTPGGSMPRSAVLWLIGGAALGLGVMVYLLDRPAAHALLQPSLGPVGVHRVFGVVGGWLPSFAHVLAFSLFSAALLAPLPRWEHGACLFWLVVNAAFEIGQHPQVREPLAQWLRRATGQGPIARAVENYFLRGTFDVGDLVASACGAWLAAAVLRRCRVHRRSHHGR